jgi:hypothetical protein
VASRAALQKRLLEVREAKAERLGWHSCHIDTTDNIPCADSLIAAGYPLFKPALPWAFSNTLYWRKKINGASDDVGMSAIYAKAENLCSI